MVGCACRGSRHGNLAQRRWNRRKVYNIDYARNHDYFRYCISYEKIVTLQVIFSCGEQVILFQIVSEILKFFDFLILFLIF